jgi:hypothetical protein
VKNSLDFNVSYNRLEGLNFIQRFATAYMHLESSAGKPDIYGYCAGCRAECTKDCAGADAIRCKFFFLFNTMCGNSALRCHFDGRLTEMQKLIGDTGTNCGDCGSDSTIDFLFGFAGYDYRKVTGGFKAEIIAAIDAGKPVIAKVKSGRPRFYLINGYDGDALICPDFIGNDWNFQTNKPDETGPDGPPAYASLDALFIFGEKTARRYTLIDGLHNIRRTMECNINEHVLDGYLEQMGESFIKASRKERLARTQRLKETVVYLFNIVSFMGAFVSDPNPHSHALHQEIWAIPGFAELSERLNEQHWIILNNGHKVGGFHNKAKKAVFAPWRIRGLSAKICETINEIKDADRKLLEIINQAIAILEEATP